MQFKLCKISDAVKVLPNALAYQTTLYTIFLKHLKAYCDLLCCTGVAEAVVQIAITFEGKRKKNENNCWKLLALLYREQVKTSVLLPSMSYSQCFFHLPE